MELKTSGDQTMNGKDTLIFSIHETINNLWRVDIAISDASLFDIAKEIESQTGALVTQIVAYCELHQGYILCRCTDDTTSEFIKKISTILTPKKV